MKNMQTFSIKKIIKNHKMKMKKNIILMMMNLINNNNRIMHQFNPIYKIFPKFLILNKMAMDYIVKNNNYLITENLYSKINSWRIKKYTERICHHQ